MIHFNIFFSSLWIWFDVERWTWWTIFLSISRWNWISLKFCGKILNWKWVSIVKSILNSPNVVLQQMDRRVKLWYLHDEDLVDFWEDLKLHEVQPIPLVLRMHPTGQVVQAPMELIVAVLQEFVVHEFVAANEINTFSNKD